MEINESAIRQYISEYENKVELAYKLDLSVTTLYNIIGGRRRAGRKVLTALARNGLPLHQLFTGGETV